MEVLINDFINEWKNKNNYNKQDVLESLKYKLSSKDINVDFRIASNKRILGRIYRELGLK